MFLVRLWLRFRSATEVHFEQSEVTRFSCGSDRLRAEDLFRTSTLLPPLYGVFLYLSLCKEILEESTMRPNSSHEIVVVSNYLQLAAVFTRWSLRRIDEFGGPCTIYLLLTAH
jgi:hypothetical protein